DAAILPELSLDPGLVEGAPHLSGVATLPVEHLRLGVVGSERTGAVERLHRRVVELEPDQPRRDRGPGLPLRLLVRLAAGEPHAGTGDREPERAGDEVLARVDPLDGL